MDGATRSSAPPADVPPDPAPRPDSWVGGVEPWLQWWRDAGAWGLGLMTVGLFYDARQLRRFWLSDLTQMTDSYLRSPALLELMRSRLRPAVGSNTSTPSTKPR
jgi:hypothetical protein